MTSLDHNRSRFGFSATRARLPVPRARLDRHDETSSTRPPVRGTTPCWISERADPRHPPPREAYPAKQFNPDRSPSQQRSRAREPMAPTTSGSWTSPIPKKVRALQAGIGVADGPCSLITGRSGLYSRSVHASSCVRYRALRRRMHPAQRYILTPMIHLRRLLRGSCRLHSLYIRTHLRLPLGARPLGQLLIHCHRLSAASSCFSARRNGEQGAAPWATTLPGAPCLHAHTSSAHPLWQVSVLQKPCTARSYLHLQRGERKCRAFPLWHRRPRKSTLSSPACN